MSFFVLFSFDSAILSVENKKTHSNGVFCPQHEADVFDAIIAANHIQITRRVELPLVECWSQLFWSTMESDEEIAKDMAMV